MVRCKQSLMLAGLLALTASPASAQQWAQDMFGKPPVLAHNFGSVARGANAEYRFRFTNIYKETLHVASVGSTCQCVTPLVTRDTLKSRESAEVIAVLNTVSFSGPRNPVITITFDKPFFAQVQLRIGVVIRADVVLDPGSVSFGRVTAGQPAERLIRIHYAGRGDWKIEDVVTANPYLEAELPVRRQGGGQVEYQMLVRLKADAPLGYLKDTLSIITNDGANARIPVDVEGKIESEVVVNPTALVFGELRPGDKVIKKVMVRGARPFRITRVECDDCIEVKTTDASKPYHLLPVTFIAGKTGHVEAKLLIETDLGQGAVSEIPVYADIVEAQEQP